jgi:hypothetical protein
MVFRMMVLTGCDALQNDCRCRRFRGRGNPKAASSDHRKGVQQDHKIDIFGA